MLKIGNKWIVSKYKQEMDRRRRTLPVMEYMEEKYDWDETVRDK